MPTQNLTLHEQLLRESAAMAKHAFSSGLIVPPQVVQKLELHIGSQSGETESNMVDLALLHQALATIVAPAMPRSILLLDDESKIQRPLSFFGPVPLVRQMMVTAVLALFSLILITLSTEINDENLRTGLTGLDGYSLLVVEMLYVTAAAMGASFAALFTANRYIVAGTFDPKYKATYWVRFILGIMAGVILADFVPVDATSQTNIHKPLLAILGGFSASLVYRILSRLVDAVESVFRGDPRDQIAANEITAKVQADARVTQMSTSVAKRLMTLHRNLGAESDPQTIADRIGEVVDTLVSPDLGVDPTAESPPPTVVSTSDKSTKKKSKR